MGLESESQAPKFCDLGAMVLFKRFLCFQKRKLGHGIVFTFSGSPLTSLESPRKFFLSVITCSSGSQSLES
jgi:hypothetical protein